MYLTNVPHWPRGVGGGGGSVWCSGFRFRDFYIIFTQKDRSSRKHGEFSNFDTAFSLQRLTKFANFQIFILQKSGKQFPPLRPLPPPITLYGGCYTHKPCHPSPPPGKAGRGTGLAGVSRLGTVHTGFMYIIYLDINVYTYIICIIYVY